MRITNKKQDVRFCLQNVKGKREGDLHRCVQTIGGEDEWEIIDSK